LPYTYWTPYFSGAQGFDSRKAAEAMRNKLAKEGIEVAIVTEMQKGGRHNGKAE
jgi:cell division protein FtsN